MNKKGFTLIELLVVVLIIAILATIALPKYQAARDRAHLSGLMTIGKNVNDASDRRSLFDNTQDTSALDLLDVSFKSNTGADCTSSSCRITVSGKDYLLRPYLNFGGLGKNLTGFWSYTNTSFGIFYVYTDTYTTTRKYRLYCYSQGGSYADVNVPRCERLALSFGASCAGTNLLCDW